MKLVGDKWFKLFVGVILAWLTLLTLSLYMQPSVQRFSLVDMQLLISTQAQQLISKHQASVPNEALQARLIRIKEVLRTYSVEQDIILLNKALVVEGDLDDVTHAILEKLEAEQ